MPQTFTDSLVAGRKHASRLMQALLYEVDSGNTAPRMAIAKAALRMLWEDTIAVQIPSKRPGIDAQIAYHLIKVMKGLPNPRD